MASRPRGPQHSRAPKTFALPGGNREFSLQVLDLARGRFDTVCVQSPFTNLLAMVACVYICVKLQLFQGKRAPANTFVSSRTPLRRSWRESLTASPYSRKDRSITKKLSSHNDLALKWQFLHLKTGLKSVDCVAPCDANTAHRMQPQTQFVTWPFVQQQLMLTPVHTALLPRLAKAALPATIASASCVSCDTLSAKSPATGNPCSLTDTVARNPLTAAVVISEGTEASSTSQEGFVDLDHWQSREPKKPATPPRQEVRCVELFRRPPSLRPKHREEFEPENKKKVTRVQLLSVRFQGETREVLAGVGGRVAQERSGRNRRKEARDREGMEQEDSHQQSETKLGTRLGFLRTDFRSS